MSAQYFGKYRGVVTDNRDPMQMGRIRARVPDVLGDAESGWALPCVPPNAGEQLGGSLLPKVGVGVWIEFASGDPNRPIWTGCFFSSAADTPPSLRVGE